MKIAEYKQMMAYLTRPGFSGGGNVLPKKKPKEEAEKVNKARKEKNFEKVKGALENPKEVKEMIDKPKRGLVDEPGSYAGAAGSGIKLTKDEIKLLKENLTKEEFKKLDFDRTGVQAGQRNYGIGQRPKENRTLFKKVRKIIDPYQAVRSTTSQIFDNEVLVKRITKLAKEGKTSNEIFDQLKNLKNFPKKYLANNIATAINELVRQGKIPEKFKKLQSTGRTAGVQADRVNKVMTIINNSIKNKTPIPSLSEIARDLEFKSPKEVGSIIRKEKGEKFYKKFFLKMQDKQKQRILKLANNGKVVQALGDGTILTDKMTKYVSKFLGTNIQNAGAALFDLKEAYDGNKPYIKVNELPKIKATKGFNIIAKQAAQDPFNNPLWNKVRVSREQKVSQAIGEGKNVLDAARRKITKAAKPVFEKLGLAKKGVGVSTDELANISTSAQYGGEGYSVYQQVLTKTGDKTKDDFNLLKAKQLDRRLVDIRKKIVQGIATPDDIKNYNTYVKKTVAQINANVPAGAKRLEAITIVPGGNPLQTVSGINKLKTDNPTAYKNIIEDSKKYKVSYNIPKSVESIYTMGDQPTIQKKIMDSLKKGFNEFDEKKLIQTIKNKTPAQIKQIFKFLPRVADVSQDDIVRFASANNIMTDATFVDQDPIQKSGRSMLDFIKDNPIMSGVTGALTGLSIPQTRQFTKKALGVGLRGLATPTSLIAGLTSNFTKLPNVSETKPRLGLEATAALAKDAVRLGQGLAKQAGQGITALGNRVPFVRKARPFVRKNLQRLLLSGPMAFKAARVLNPIGQLALLGEGAYALGKAGVAERQRIKAMSPEERELFNAQQEGISEFAAAGGGIAKLAGKSSGPAPESGPTPQGLDFLMKRGR